MTDQFPVDLKIVASITGPAGQHLDTIEIDMATAAPMQQLAIELDRRGYAPMTYDAETRTWRTTEQGARRT